MFIKAVTAATLALTATAIPTPKVVANLAQSLQGSKHPTLPDRWSATVHEAELGWVEESYKMVEVPTPANPSGKWTNFTDGSCQRLILDPDLPDAMRYLLQCDAVDCCVEEQSGNHVEYQIPNVHPAVLAPVTHLGQVDLTLDQPDGSQKTVTADEWTWKFTAETFYAYTTGSGNTGVKLWQWKVNVEGDNITNTYLNYTAPTDVPAFDAQFNVPEQCNHPNVLKCDEAFKMGKLSKKSLQFVKAGKYPYPPTSTLELDADDCFRSGCPGGLKCETGDSGGICVPCTGQYESPCGNKCCLGGQECHQGGRGGDSCDIP